MPNKKLIDREESVTKRPRRIPKTKVAFDPSNDIIPDKKKKYSHTYEKPTEEKKVKKIIKKKSKTVQTATIGRKILRTKKSKRVLVNPVSKITKLMGCLSTEIDPTSPMNSSLTPKTSETCYLCSTDSEMKELVDCPICSIKVHKHCLVVNEPAWIYRLDLSPWFCPKCRKQNCIRCLKDESQSEIAFRCVSCEIGLHTNCYESYFTKQMHQIKDNLYICVPCADLATQIHPKEIGEKDDDDNEDDVEPKPGTSGTVYAPSGGDDSDSKTDSSLKMLHDELEYPSNKIPNITKWTKAQVLEYLSKKLSEKITDQIAKHDLDGRALLLMDRSDIISTKMGLKLGEALKFYKEVRILQSQSTHRNVYWE